MDVIMYFRPRGCPKTDKICGSWIGALGGYAGVLAHATISEITIFSSMLMSGKGL